MHNFQQKFINYLQNKYKHKTKNAKTMRTIEQKLKKLNGAIGAPFEWLAKIAERNLVAATAVFLVLIIIANLITKW